MFASGSSPQNIADMIGFLKGEFAADKKSAEIYRDEWEGSLEFIKAIQNKSNNYGMKPCQLERK